MAWGKAGSTTLASAGDTLTTTGMTASKFNQFLEHEIATGNIDNPKWTFNNNTNSVYAFRINQNGGSDGTNTSQTGIIANLGNAQWDRFIVNYACSISGEEKLLIFHEVASNAAGAGNAPARMEMVGKFVPSPDADITRVDVTNGGSGDFDTSSNISALGSEVTPSAGKPTNVQVGSRWEETDTRKMYHYESPSVTYTGDYSTQVGWTSNNSRISITGGYAYMNNSGSAYGDYIYTPLALTLDDDKWYLEFEYYNIGAINFYPFVLAAGTSLVGNNNVNQDFIGISESNPNMLMIRYKDGSSNVTGNTNSSTMSTNTPYYCTISRDGQVLTFKIYTDSARTLQFGSTQTLTISGTVSGLTHLHHSGLNIGGGTSGYNFKVRGTKIWNGVTSTDTVWSEEGT